MGTQLRGAETREGAEERPDGCPGSGDDVDGRKTGHGDWLFSEVRLAERVRVEIEAHTERGRKAEGIRGSEQDIKIDGREVDRNHRIFKTQLHTQTRTHTHTRRTHKRTRAGSSWAPLSFILGPEYVGFERNNPPAPPRKYCLLVPSKAVAGKVDQGRPLD